MLKFNTGGNSYPEGQPVFTIVVLKDARMFKKGDILRVMESQNDTFNGMWRVNDSMFVRKDHCKVI